MPEGDAAHTDFTVVASNPDADLGHYSPGLVATEQMYQLRSARNLESLTSQLLLFSPLDAALDVTDQRLATELMYKRSFDHDIVILSSILQPVTHAKQSHSLPLMPCCIPNEHLGPMDAHSQEMCLSIWHLIQLLLCSKRLLLLCMSLVLCRGAALVIARPLTGRTHQV